jgi:ABC-type metal ion transport system substrate-binding protein
MNNDPQRGYTIDAGRRLKRRLAAGIGAGVLILVIAIVAIQASSGSNASAGQFGSTLKIGFNSAFASEEKLIDYVASDVAPHYGLKIEPVSLGDPQQIDRSVSDGALAGTIYEHKYWMQSEIESGGFRVSAVLPIYKWAFAVYSDKYTNVNQLPDGAKIGVPADPSNQSQALWLLAHEGLITLKQGTQPWTAALSDVEGNPHHFNLTPLELAVMPRALSSLAAGMSYVDFFHSAGVPSSKAILSPPGPEAFNAQLVVGSNHLKDTNIKKLIALWKDPRIQQYLTEHGSPALFPVTAKS